MLCQVLKNENKNKNKNKNKKMRSEMRCKEIQKYKIDSTFVLLLKKLFIY